MTRPTAFIHIGLAKTGTTAIQQAASDVQDDMLAQGLRYLRTGRLGPKGGQHGLAWRIRQDARADLHCPEYTLSDTRIELAANPGRNVLVSSEEFSPLAYQRRKMAELHRLFDGYHLCAIAYLREQVEHFNSFFVELVKDIDMTLSIGEFVQKVAAEKRYDYASWMQPFAEDFDQLIVRPYDAAEFLGGEIVQDFYGLVGFAPETAAANTRRNPSLSALQVAALQHAARRLAARGITLEGQAGRQVKRKLFALVQTPKMRASGPYWGIPPQLARQLRDQFRFSNAAFFETHTGKPYDFPNHQSPRRLNVAAFTDVPPGIKAQIADLVDTLPASA